MTYFILGFAAGLGIAYAYPGWPVWLRDRIKAWLTKHK